MAKLYWEDFTPGKVFESPPRLVSRKEIVAFAAEFDPQPMHLDENAGRESMLGGLSASGWHSCCLLMRLISDSFIANSHFLGSPGVEEVRWLAPLRPGESVVARGTVVETRPSKSRPDRGFVTFRFELISAAGAPLMVLTVIPMFARRASAAAAESMRA